MIEDVKQAAETALSRIGEATTAEEVLARNPDGILLSNGPGDPAATAEYAGPEARCDAATLVASSTKPSSSTQ